MNIGFQVKISNKDTNAELGKLWFKKSKAFRISEGEIRI